ncbi:MAG TPA: helix-turn-helix domain-containing protein [Stellaceae bacterium]|nr:helix-turn-helix domain-containing protein [Stellaceae bacterium]
MARPSATKLQGNQTQRPRGQFDEGQLKSIDAAVGAQVRLRRILLGLSQESVSKTMELTFQQLQKYEHGTNRISASRLYQLATILHVPVSYFFETIDADEIVAPETETAPPPGEGVSGDLMKKRKTVELVRAFYAIEGERQRNAALNLLKTLGKDGSK